MRQYTIVVMWDDTVLDRPFVYALDPRIKPREGNDYRTIPHLIYDHKNPDLSGFCLFDPDANEWNASYLIAETTILWAIERLDNYEHWHLCGRWLGPSAGPETVTDLTPNQVELVQETKSDVHKSAASLHSTSTNQATLAS